MTFKIITRVYKIVDKDNTPVYIGVTTRPLYKRFNEHVKTKNLDKYLYKCIEIDRIVHPTISDEESFKQELKKVKDLEKRYINEYQLKFDLLNRSNGGEWGSCISNKILKTNVLLKYADYNVFKRIMSFRKLLRYWCFLNGFNRTKIVLKSWVGSNKINKTKRILKNWINHKNKNKTKQIIKTWLNTENISKTKQLLKRWVCSKTNNKTKRLLENWINHKTQNNTEQIIKNWINHKGDNTK